MLTVPHAIMGATIASKVSNPLLFPPLAILSHFLLDFLIPHWNPHLYTEYHTKKSLTKTTKEIIFLDGLLAIISTAFIASLKLPNLNQAFFIFLGAGFGVLPDAIEIPHYFFGFRNKILSAYIKFGHDHQKKASFFPGLVTQLLTVLICLLVIFLIS
jgi:hypothetical protein